MGIAISASACLEPFSAMRCFMVAGLTSGCTLKAGYAVYIDSNGTLQPTVQTQQSGSLTLFDGLVAKDAVSGDYGLTVWGKGARFNYSTGLTPGQLLYVASSGSEGGLTTTPKMFAGYPGAGGSVCDLPVAKAVTATDIVIVR